MSNKGGAYPVSKRNYLGIISSREEISMISVHDVFTEITT